MAIEIERKFLLKNDAWRKEKSQKSIIAQAYLNSDKERTVRIRIRDDKAFLTIKSKNQGIVRQEFEYEIPLVDGQALLSLGEMPAIEKHRYSIMIADHLFEIDEFFAANQGLVLAEVELSQYDENFVKPDWLGEEVSDDKRYFNSYLSRHPFTTW